MQQSRVIQIMVVPASNIFDALDVNKERFFDLGWTFGEGCIVHSQEMLEAIVEYWTIDGVRGNLLTELKHKYWEIVEDAYVQIDG